VTTLESASGSLSVIKLGRTADTTIN